MTRRKGVADPEGTPFFATTCLGFQHALNTDAYYVPLRLRDIPHAGKKTAAKQLNLLHKPESGTQSERPNLSQPGADYLKSLGLDRAGDKSSGASAIWLHALASGYAPAYLSDNADGIRQDWPRIPSRAPVSHCSLPQRLAARLLHSSTLKLQLTASPLVTFAPN